MVSAENLTGAPDANKNPQAAVKSMFKVIVAGGRDLTDYALLSSTLQHILSGKWDVEIVSGVAREVDSLAVKCAVLYSR